MRMFRFRVKGVGMVRWLIVKPFTKNSYHSNIFTCVVFLVWLLPSPLFSQTWPAKWQENGVSASFPVEGGYDTVQTSMSNFQAYDFAIASRKEKLEIRYWFNPYDSTATESQYPSVAASVLAIHLTDNDTNIPTAVFKLADDVVKFDYQGDWGAEYVFAPKTQFSDTPYCRMLCLFRNGYGNIYVFFLYNDLDNPWVDTREEKCVRFISGR